MTLLRAFQPKTGDHLYTTDAAELRDAVDRLGYVAEASAVELYAMQTGGTVPLWRLWLPATNDHFYTTDAEERVRAFQGLGYRSEGVTGYVFTGSRPGTVPLFRSFQRQSGDHFYTTDVREHFTAVHDLGYVDEGIACYTPARRPMEPGRAPPEERRPPQGNGEGREEPRSEGQAPMVDLLLFEAGDQITLEYARRVLRKIGIEPVWGTTLAWTLWVPSERVEAARSALLEHPGLLRYVREFDGHESPQNRDGYVEVPVEMIYERALTAFGSSSIVGRLLRSEHFAGPNRAWKGRRIRSVFYRERPFVDQLLRPTNAIQGEIVVLTTDDLEIYPPSFLFE